MASADRVVVAKIESQIRSVFDFELVVIAHALGATAEDFLLSLSRLRRELEELGRGKRADE